MLENIAKYNLILGSGSPRRFELLEQLKLPFQVIVSRAEEIYPPDLPIEEVPAYLSELKANDLKRLLTDDDLLITSDTLVFYNEEILGKPTDDYEAQLMLLKLSGNKHTVVTAITICVNNKMVTLSDSTEVYFSDISEEEANWYVSNCEVLDKAGAYGVQDWIGMCKIDKIEGSHYNIMGLPMHLLYRMLQDI